MNPVYFTICSANYLPYARTLFASLQEVAPQSKFYCFIVDEARDRVDYTALGFECVEVKDIDCDHVFDMAARYTIMEFNTAIKPFCFQWILANRREDFVIYLDPDILVVSDPVELRRELEAGASIVLTPHTLAPLDDGKDPDDVTILRAGTYNLGFCAIRRSAPAEAFLAWWGKHLLDKCVVDLDKGYFVDQKFCDLAPSYFDNVRVLRHPGYNVAYWNLLGRKVEQAESVWLSNGLPLRFFHFSGVVPSDPTIFSKHQNRFTPRNIGGLRPLFDLYLARLRANANLGALNFYKLPYTYARLANGLGFTDQMRKIYGDLHPAAPRAYTEAFDGSLGQFLTLAPDVPQDAAPITRLMRRVWLDREDLRNAFSLKTPESREAYLSWFLDTATRECKIPAEIVEATRALKEPDASLARREPDAQTGIRAMSASTQRGRAESWAPMRRISAATGIGLSMFGYFRAENGLGAAARANFLAARAAGVDVAAHNILCEGFKNRVDPPFPLDATAETKDCVLFHVNADQVERIESFVDPARLRGRHRIGYWAWELASLPIEWVGAYRKVDEVWAPSRFAAHAFVQRTRMPVTVIPHPVETPSPPANIAALRARFALPADRLIFLTAFDLNSYIERKNPFATIEAFKRAFPPGADSPRLVVKLHGDFHRDARFERLMSAILDDSRIVLIDRVLSSDDISDLQWCCDAFVSLHRSEGFGLWIAECMARGKPCIVTNYSGNVDFANAGNSLPVGFSMVKVRKGDYPFGEGQWWAEPHGEGATLAMKQLAGDAALRQRLGEAARHHVAEHLSPRAVGSAIAERLYRSRAELIDLPQLIAS